MFRKTKKNQQLNLFTSSHNILRGRALRVYEDSKEWHNQFRAQVTERIEEDIFRPLFCDGFGAPNASIRVLVGMMILKEANGWSDSQLFDHTHFNLRVRSALGLHNLDDPTPVDSTYYLLRRRIVDWESENNENLLEKVFAQVTRSQVIDFNINGNKIRMDSKLLGSNIAWYNRYELIHETIRKTYDHIKFQIDYFMPDLDIVILKEIFGELGNKVSYRSNKSELESKLVRLGPIIYNIINYFHDKSIDSIETLRQVFYQHYEVVDDTVNLLPKQQLKASNIQSPHDTDCTFRDKGDICVKGYSINTTETCNPDNPLNLIVNVIVESASQSDCDFLIPAVEYSQEVVFQNIETVNSDAAYHSIVNQDYCEDHDIDLIVSGLTGRSPKYELDYDENNNLTATCLATNQTVPVIKVETKNPDAPPRWKIKKPDGKPRYFKQEEIDSSVLRKKLATYSRAEMNLRNNVEASIFQLGYHYPNRKSRYRQLSKHRIWANARCLWINFVRIMKYFKLLEESCAQMELKCIQMKKIYASIANILSSFCLKMAKYAKFKFKMIFAGIFSISPQKIAFTTCL